MTSTDENRTGTMNKEHRILVIGKSGNGKSAVCNTLVGSQQFALGRGLSATTRTLQVSDAHRYGYHMQVVDTPDITNTDMSQQEMQAEVRRWREVTSPFPTAVLLTVRCDVRYTAEEHDIYRQIQRHWGDNSLGERLVVAFTFGDRQDVPLEEELRTVCRELKGVLRDASHRYVMFSNKAPAHEREEQVQRLLSIANTSPMVTGRPLHKYVIPGLCVASLVSGLCFAASITANNAGSSIAFGLLCLATGAAVVLLKIKEKMP
ncbi:GTPase IMAP family member 9-like isoform X2 [Babylonia areolata]